MEAIAWEEIQRVNPTLTESYVAAFRAIPPTQVGIEQSLRLQQELAARLQELAAQGRFPDYDTLFTQACNASNLDPATIRQT